MPASFLSTTLFSFLVHRRSLVSRVIVAGGFGFALDCYNPVGFVDVIVGRDKVVWAIGGLSPSPSCISGSFPTPSSFGTFGLILFFSTLYCLVAIANRPLFQPVFVLSLGCFAHCSKVSGVSLLPHLFDPPGRRPLPSSCRRHHAHYGLTPCFLHPRLLTSPGVDRRNPPEPADDHKGRCPSAPARCTPRVNQRQRLSRFLHARPVVWSRHASSHFGCVVAKFFFVCR